MIIHSILSKSQINYCSYIVWPKVKGLLVGLYCLRNIHVVGHASTVFVPEGMICWVFFDSCHETLASQHIVSLNEIQYSQCHQNLSVARFH